MKSINITYEYLVLLKYVMLFQVNQNACMVNINKTNANLKLHFIMKSSPNANLKLHFIMKSSPSQYSCKLCTQKDSYTTLYTGTTELSRQELYFHMMPSISFMKLSYASSLVCPVPGADLVEDTGAESGTLGPTKHQETFISSSEYTCVTAFLMLKTS